MEKNYLKFQFALILVLSLQFIFKTLHSRIDNVMPHSSLLYDLVLTNLPKSTILRKMSTSRGLNLHGISDDVIVLSS